VMDVGPAGGGGVWMVDGAASPEGTAGRRASSTGRDDGLDGAAPEIAGESGEMEAIGADKRSGSWCRSNVKMNVKMYQGGGNLNRRRRRCSGGLGVDVDHHHLVLLSLFVVFASNSPEKSPILFS
jgi:hypothetical protein